MDDWPLAIIILDLLGGKPKLITAFLGVISGRHPPLESLMLQYDKSLLGLSHSCGGKVLGELSGGNWISDLECPGLRL